LNTKNWVIITHHEPHPDEIAAIRELLRNGEGRRVDNRVLSGISKARIKFVDAGEEWMIPLKQTNIITVGTGKQLFDEHISTPRADRMRECALTLLIKELEITGIPQRWTSYILRHDLEGEHLPMDFADFIGSLYLSMKEEDVLVLGIKIIDALLDSRYLEMEMTQEVRDSAADFIEQWLKTKKNNTVRPIVKFVNGIRNGNKADYDFTEIFTKLKLVYGETEAAKIATTLLETKYHRQQMSYQEAEKLVLDPKVTMQDWVRRKDRTFLVVSTKVPVDNVDYNKAARKILKADVIIQKNSSGRVLIFTNAKTPMKRELTNIVVVLRLEEMYRRKIPFQYSFKRLAFGGAIPEVPQWYFQIENKPSGGKLLNGSKTAKGIEPTIIPIERIKEIVLIVLQLGYNFRLDVWIKKNYF